MAHFAELKTKVDPTGHTSDTHQVVERVVVVGNDISTAAGDLGNNDMHVDGETWCANFFKVEVGNKLLTIIILENNTQVLEWFMIL